MTTKLKPLSEKDKAQRRVAIAKDVIKQFTNGRYLATCGTYIAGAAQPTSDHKEFVESVQCSVCALGSMLLSHIYKYNNFPILDLFTDPCDRTLNVYRYDCENALYEEFTPQQLSLIEVAYEGRYNVPREVKEYLSYEETIQADRFNTKHSGDSKKRLLAIMRNIVRNKGTFKLPSLPKYY